MRLLRLVVVALATLLLQSPTVAWCQSTKGRNVAEVAKQRFLDGVAAARDGNYEAARAAFQQSYSLKPASPTLRGLAEAELRTGHFVAAATDFALYMRTAGVALKDLEPLRDSLAAATAHVGTVVIEIGAPGWEVTLDEQIVGLSPLPPDPFYVEPGDHRVRARARGRPEQVRPFRVGAGEQARIEITHAELSGASAPAASIQAPSGAPAPRPIDFDPGDLRSPAPSSSGDSARVIVMGTGAGLALIGLGVGIAYSLKSSSEDQDVERLSADAAAQLGSMPCQSSIAVCSELESAVDRRKTATTTATVAFGAAAIFGAAALVTFFLWPVKTNVARVRLTPVVGTSELGLGMVGAL